mgnify:CR=1 FL=1
MPRFVEQWVEEVRKITQPDKVMWCDGSEEENRRFISQMLTTGEVKPLNQESYPNCYLHRSHSSDVARTEHLTFICSKNKDDAGPTNNWMSPEEAKNKVGKLFEGSMKGRTMYVVPYIMGPEKSPYSKCGVEITDSAYVVVSMRIMTRMGKVALDRIGETNQYVKGLHSLGDLSPDRRFILHFPEERTIWSIGSGYGGNALLGKKCFALRIAGAMARDEGWMAEHMMIIGVEDPHGKTTYLAAAFPSACGKTNLAMLVPPKTMNGYKIWTVGDDIAWLNIGKDGRLYAINPEAGFFGVAPGTGTKTNSNAMKTLKQNSIFTNVGLNQQNEPVWEGIDHFPESGTDWQGNPWSKTSGTPIAHPNSRFTTPAKQCPSISPELENPQGIPISGIIFGGRRAKTAPLVFEARNWIHGVFVGASVASETTAAATGKVGVVRRDSMAMLPFCGYNMADYFQHWLKMGEKLGTKAPKIFHVNWFRTNEQGKFLWPGFGENLRVIEWMIGRIEGKAEAKESEIGLLPTKNAINMKDLSLADGGIEELLTIKREDWKQEITGIKEFFEKFGNRLPSPLWKEYERLEKQLTL